MEDMRYSTFVPKNEMSVTKTKQNTCGHSFIQFIVFSYSILYLHIKKCSEF